MFATPAPTALMVAVFPFPCTVTGFTPEAVTPGASDFVGFSEADKDHKLRGSLVFPPGGVVTGQLVFFDSLASGSGIIYQYLTGSESRWQTAAPLDRSTVTLTQAVLGSGVGEDVGVAHGTIDAVLDPLGWSIPLKMPQVAIHIDF